MSRFLFKAYFTDGTVYEQGEADASLWVKDKSSFFDVLFLEKNGENPLLRFELSNGVNTYAVNLKDGSFEVNNVPFVIMNKPEISENFILTNYRLIFFRRVTKIFSPNNMYQGEKIEFNFGWQANDPSGNNIKQIMTILE